LKVPPPPPPVDVIELKIEFVPFDPAAAELVAPAPDAPMVTEYKFPIETDKALAL
jgi:hypothetical protein